MIYQALPLPNTFYTGTDSIYLLDIETTGLCKQSDSILMIGLLENNVDKFFYHFWLCEHPQDEKEALNAFLTHLDFNRKLYTYGGTSFDLAFISTRSALYDLELSHFMQLSKVDFKKLPLFKSLFPNQRLNRLLLETHFHYTRTLTTKGRELAKIASLYSKAPTTLYQELLMKHNEEDLLSLLTFWYVHQLLNHLHPSQCIHTQLESDCITYSFKAPVPYPSALNLQLGAYHICYRPDTTTLEVTLKAKQLILKQYLPYKDYYIVNGTPMHHSLAQFIPSDLKKKATQATAFLEKEDLYIPSPKQEGCWQDEAKNTYIPFIEVTHVEAAILKDLSKKITRGLIN